MYRAYEDAKPGTAEWLMKMAENDQATAKDLSARALTEESKLKRLLAWQGFGVSVAGVAAGWLIGIDGSPLAASIIVSACGAFGGRLVYNLLWARRSVSDTKRE